MTTRFYDYCAENPDWKTSSDRWTKDQHVYCHHCGSLMAEVSDSTPIPTGYNTITGAPTFRVDGTRFWQCPQWMKVPTDSPYDKSSNEHDQFTLCTRHSVSHLTPVQECHAWAHVWVMDVATGAEPYQIRHCTVCARPEIKNKRTHGQWALHDDGHRVNHCPDCGTTWYVCLRPGSGGCTNLCPTCGRWRWSMGSGVVWGQPELPQLPPIIGIPRGVPVDNPGEPEPEPSPKKRWWDFPTLLS